MTEHIQVVPDKCRACRRCEVACIAAHHGMSFKEAMKHRDELVSRVQVVKADGFKTTVRCHQCPHAPCVNVCPTGALQQDEKGRIIMRVQYCVACKMCIAACPYGTITMETIGMPSVDGEDGETLAQRARREVAVRCDMCRAWRMDNGKRITACMEACPAHALSLVLADGTVVEMPKPEKKAVEPAADAPKADAAPAAAPEASKAEAAPVVGTAATEAPKANAAAAVVAPEPPKADAAAAVVAPEPPKADTTSAVETAATEAPKAEAAPEAATAVAAPAVEAAAPETPKAEAAPAVAPEVTKAEIVAKAVEPAAKASDTQAEQPVVSEVKAEAQEVSKDEPQESAPAEGAPKAEAPAAPKPAAPADKKPAAPAAKKPAPKAGKKTNKKGGKK